MFAHKKNYDTLSTTDLPERGTREWYLAKRARKLGRARGGGRAGKFREINRHKPVSIDQIIADKMPKHSESEYWFYVWNVGVCRCVYCGAKLNRENRTQDHVVPKAKGGTHLGRTNLMPSCQRCNWDKSDRSLLEFLVDGGMKPDDMSRMDEDT